MRRKKHITNQKTNWKTSRHITKQQDTGMWWMWGQHCAVSAVQSVENLRRSDYCRCDFQHHPHFWKFHHSDHICVCGIRCPISWEFEEKRSLSMWLSTSSSLLKVSPQRSHLCVCGIRCPISWEFEGGLPSLLQELVLTRCFRSPDLQPTCSSSVNKLELPC